MTTSKAHTRNRRYRQGERMPKEVQEWAALYESGWTLDGLAFETGWRPNRRGYLKHRGTSPSSMRNILQSWGVTMRKQGGRGAAGTSALVRIAELERQVKELQRLLMGD